MPSRTSFLLFAAVASLVATHDAVAFSTAAVSAPSSLAAASSITMLSATSSNNDNNNDNEQQLSRRQAFLGMAAAAAATWTAAAQPANAKYSDYSRREKDWQERQDNGEVQFSSARSLKAQLAEIAPQNTEASRIFCPNGPSAAVSPLMENKCGDRLAAPSVYGRRQDIVGNSIPGFTGNYLPGESASTIAASAGGFPSYKENEYTLKMR